MKDKMVINNDHTRRGSFTFFGFSGKRPDHSPVFRKIRTTHHPQTPSPASPRKTNSHNGSATFCQKPRSVFDVLTVKKRAKSGEKLQNHHTYAQNLRTRKNPRKPMFERLSGDFTSRGTRTRTQDTRFWSQWQMSKISQCLSDSCSARPRKRCVFDAVPKFPGVPDALAAADSTQQRTGESGQNLRI